jgi:fumarate reductase flavoprotein subunit
VAVRSRATLLAMGGGPTMYRVIACSADKSADGIALALRAGARLKDMEMVQFHPTGLIVPNSLMTGALLEEGLRGAGGRLFNGRGERFMERYDPARMERSTRDLVARASFMEVLEGRGTPHGGVWIDVSHLGAKMVETNFRGMVKRCRDFGYDLANDPVEVGPTAHFMMGGVAIAPSCTTDVEGLFAAGEDAGGIHGANRLGGNGVADSTVFGGIAGDTMADWVVARPTPRLSRTATEGAAHRVAGPLGRAEGDNVYALLARLRTVMWDHVGLIRTGDNLKHALGEIEEIGRRAEGAAVPGGRAFNLAWQDWLNLQSQATAAWLICRSAWERAESRGSHFRKDFPEPLGELFNVYVGFADGTMPKVWTEPVRLTRLTPEAARPGLSVEVGD